MSTYQGFCIVSITVHVDLPRVFVLQVLLCTETYQGFLYKESNTNVFNNSKQVAVYSKITILQYMSYQLVNNHLGRNRMGVVMANELSYMNYKIVAFEILLNYSVN
jgi:hypothetical protein